LAEEIRRREEEVERIRRHVDEKDEETRRLQQEVEDARLRQQEAQEALMTATTQALHHNRMNNAFEDTQFVGESDIHEPEHDHEPHHEHYEHDRMSNGGMRKEVELTTDADAELPQYEIDRETHVEKTTGIRERLEELKLELEETRIPERVTDDDVRYLHLSSVGQTKYKTLTQIRAGTAKRRIDQFENL